MSSLGLSVSAFNAGVIGMHSHARLFTWVPGLELRSLCLQNKHSYLLSYVSSPMVHHFSLYLLKDKNININIFPLFYK